MVESSNLNIILSMLQSVFSSCENIDSPYSHISTQSAAVCASLSILHEIPMSQTHSGESCEQLEELFCATFPIVHYLLNSCVENDDMTNMTAVGESLSRLVKARPLLFRDCWSPILDVVKSTCLGTSDKGGVSDDSVKCVMLDLLVDFVTGKESASYCCNQETRAQCVSLCISLLCLINIPSEEEMSDDYLWKKCAVNDDAFGDEDGDEDMSSVLAGSILGTFLRKWPIQEMMACCLESITRLFQDSNDYNAVRAALFITSILHDLLGVEMQEHMSVVAPTLFIITTHPHPRLRLCALLCIKSVILSDDGDDDQEDFRSSYGEQLLPLILESIADNIGHPRIACQGVNTLRAFCDPRSCPQSVISPPYIQSMLDMALNFLTNTSEYPEFLLEECIPLVGNLSIIDRDTFSPYYDKFMGLQKGILMVSSSASDGDLQELRGQCLESCALMGSSVGFDRFFSDATQLLDYMITIQGDVRSCDFSDPIASYIVQSCARIAGVLGGNFEPYIQRILPVLLEHVSQDIQHIVQTEDQFGSHFDGANEEYTTIYKRGTGNLRIFNNSHAMKEKEMSLRTLYQYLIDVPALMMPYFEEILVAIARISPSQFCTEDNADSLNVISVIVSDMCKLLLQHRANFDQDNILNFIERGAEYILSTLQEANKLSGQVSGIEFSAAAVENVRATLQILVETNSKISSPYISHDIGAALFMALSDQIQMWLTRKYGGDGENVNDAVRNREDGEQQQLEDDLWLALTDSVGYLFKVLSTVDAVDLFQNDVLPFFGPLLPACENSIPLLSLLISTLTEAVEAFSANAKICNSIIEVLAPLLFKYVEEEDLTMLCIYGIGACSLHGNCYVAWSEFSDEAVHLLHAYFVQICGQEHDMWDEEMKGTMVSAIFKLCISQDNTEDLLKQVLLSLFPITIFPYEARECHNLLVNQMIEKNLQLVGGAEGENLPQLFAIIAQLCSLYHEAKSFISIIFLK